MQIKSDIALVAGYEIAKGENIDARTARIGFDVAPWAGGRITRQRQPASRLPNTARAPLQLTVSRSHSRSATNGRWISRWTATRRWAALTRADVVNPLQPVASGGFLGSDGTLTEDFTAVTAGATYHGERWSWTGRAEYRDGETTNRYGATTAILRQIGEGRAVGGSFSWFRAKDALAQAQLPRRPKSAGRTALPTASGRSSTNQSSAMTRCGVRSPACRVRSGAPR